MWYEQPFLSNPARSFGPRGRGPRTLSRKQSWCRAASGLWRRRLHRTVDLSAANAADVFGLFRPSYLAARRTASELYLTASEDVLFHPGGSADERQSFCTRRRDVVSLRVCGCMTFGTRKFACRMSRVCLFVSFLVTRVRSLHAFCVYAVDMKHHFRSLHSRTCSYLECLLWGGGKQAGPRRLRFW